MNIKQIKYFQDVVRLASFTQAAAINFISQSAISQQIQALEKELGVPLFERKNRSFELTRAGQYFFEQSEPWLKELEDILQETQQRAGEDKTELKIGLLWGLSRTRIKESLLRFQSQFSQLKLDMMIGSHEDLSQAMSQRRIDCVIGDQRKAFSDHYANIQIQSLPQVIRLSANHPLAHEPALELSDLPGYPLYILASRGQERMEKDFYRDYFASHSPIKCAYSQEELDLKLLTSQAYQILEEGMAQADPAFVEIPLLQEGDQLKRNYYLFYPLDSPPLYQQELLELLSGD